MCCRRVFGIHPDRGCGTALSPITTSSRFFTTEATSVCYLMRHPHCSPDRCRRWRYVRPTSGDGASAGQRVPLSQRMRAALNYCSAGRRLQEVETVLNDTWYSRDLPVLTAIAEKLERGSAPVDTEQLIGELGLTRQDLTAALRALEVEYLIVRWPERITYRRSDPSILVERITSRAREAVGLWPSTEARQTAQRQTGDDQE
jgi:hypothetical protein